MSAPELELQRLPRWLAGGPWVTEVAYRICVVAVGRFVGPGFSGAGVGA